MSEQPENIVNRMGRRARRVFNRYLGEPNEAYMEESRNRWEIEDEIGTPLINPIVDEDGDPISMSASTASRSESWAEHQRRSEISRMTGIDLSNIEEHVEKYNDKDHKGSIFLTEAMRKSRKIQKRWPKRLLCGGVALYLYGVIKRERFSDLDFVSYESNVVDNECVSLECSKPYTHCLFLSPDVEPGSVIDGIRLQKLDQILYWKMRYDRPKDQKDLKDYLDKQFLKADDFKL